MTRFTATFAKPRLALESAHAIAAAERIAPTLGKDKIIVVNCSGRGDKDIFTVADALGVKL